MGRKVITGVVIVLAWAVLTVGFAAGVHAAASAIRADNVSHGKAGR